MAISPQFAQQIQQAQNKPENERTDEEKLMLWAFEEEKKRQIAKLQEK